MKAAMSLIQPLPPGPLDIVGDIHGEYDALCQLLAHLGYDAHGHHSEGRTLVFVGDFCDRGPDSPAVLALVQSLVQAGRAAAVLGNHEINLLREDAKDGSGWFFDARMARDQEKYAPFHRPTPEQRQDIVGFLSSLPLGLERPDLRVIHAAWMPREIAIARALPAGSARQSYDSFEIEAARQARASRLTERLHEERRQWPHNLEDRGCMPPFLPAHSENELNKAMFNPLKVLTTGVERECRQPFYAGGKWRFVERVGWWNDYTDDIPVIVGHYWRRWLAGDAPPHGSQFENLFGGVSPRSWLGAQGNVFCVDYSVGGRWNARQAGEDPHLRYKLAALRWPERSLMLDDGTVALTTGFESLAAQS